MNPATHPAPASMTSGSATTGHWADELPPGLWLEAAEFDDIPYTFLRHPASEQTSRRPPC
jgi:hypothetical protein